MDLNTHAMVVESDVLDCCVELYVNDIPVGLCGIGASRRTAIPIHEFLVDGPNDCPHKAANTALRGAKQLCCVASQRPKGAT